MAFRKQYPQRIFVDESIPSFLAARSNASHPSARPVRRAVKKTPRREGVEKSASPAWPAAPLSETAQAETAQAVKRRERRNRPLKLTPAFLLRLIALGIGLNAGLFWLFHLPASQPDRLVRREEPAPAPVQARAAPLEERVVTYSYKQPGSGPGNADE